MSIVTAPLKWHGGKAYLAQRIIALMPPRVVNGNSPAQDDSGWLHYVEPYFGGGQVLLANDPEGISEVASDLHGGLINFWKVLADADQFEMFRRLIEATPFSEERFRAMHLSARKWPHELAAVFFVECRQSLAGRMAGFTGVTKTRTRRGMNNEVSAWLTAVEGLPAVHERLKRVLVIDQSALDVICKHDGPRTLFYLDPPYLHETRATTGEYLHEMTMLEHQALLEQLTEIKGRFILSGYPSPLYDRFEMDHNWRHVDFDLPNHSSSAKTKQRKTERVWMNYEATP